MFSGLKMEIQAADKKKTNKRKMRCFKVSKFKTKCQIIAFLTIWNALFWILLNLDNFAIIHPGLDGNDVVHNFDSTKRSVLLDPSTLPWFCECSCGSLFLFYAISHNQNIVQWKTEFFIFSYFHRTTHWL